MVSPTRHLKLRGADPTGNGWYGADRSGGRKHKGIDIVAQPGERIFSPITGKITRSGLVYTFTRKFKLLVISNDIYEVKLMYMEPHPFNPGDLVYECAEIGINQDVANYWGKGMVNHIHMEVRKYGLLTDPEPLLIKPDWL